MSKLVYAVVAAVVLVGGYFGAQSMGLLGTASMTVEDAEAALQAKVDEVTSAGNDLKFDDFSRIVGAERDGLTVTMAGKSLLTMDKVNDGYLDSRVAQAGNKLCRDAEFVALLAAGGKIIYNWVSFDDQEIGQVTVEKGSCDAYQS